MNESVIFNAAVKLPKEQRTEFLDAACAGDPRLRAEVEDLLQEHDTAGSFLDRPAANPSATDLFRPITEGPGTIIGPYKLLQQIGEGGFGVVYMAEQQRPVRRKVALKIIKPGMDTREVVARFESERQALALMDHPNIARVLDGGTTESGRPYFVMELVKGVPLTQFCDDNKLDTRQRLALFTSVCKAIQHAHHKGVIHRDIKPNNVMVTLHDGLPVPKVIDFGVSKAVAQQLTEKTMFTAYGQMIGTPAYMSPEQAEMSGLDIDTRSDVYSLGVLLYELLTGSTPLEVGSLRGKAFAELQRMIREDEPPRPSLRVSTQGAATATIAAHRGTVPRELGAILRGELDWIVMKALEKQRERRYESPNAFADDIQRFLSHEAIVARPASATYRLKKFAQRNWAAVTAGSAIAAALLLGTATSTSFAIREGRASRLAQIHLVEAKQQRELAVAAKDEALRERDRAERATAEESKQRQLALEQKQAAEDAERAATADRTAAEQERDKAQALADELNRRKEQQRRMLYVAQMNLIQKAWDANNIRRVRDLLNASRPQTGEEDLRNIEWHYWQHMLHQEERSFKLGESLVVEANARSAPQLLAAFSRDGTRLAAIVSQDRSGEAKQILKVWDTATERQVFENELPADTARLLRICYLDAQRVALSEANRLDVSELRAAFERERPSPGPEARERSRELSERSRAASRVVLRVLQLDTQETAFPPLEIKPGVLTATGSGHFAFDLDGSRCAAVIAEQEAIESEPQAFVQIWDARTGVPLTRVKATATPIVALALSPDGTRVAVAQPPIALVRSEGSGGRGPAAQPASPTGQVQIVDVASGSIVTTMETYTRPIMEFSPDGTRLVVLGTTAGRTGRGATMFDSTTGAEIFSITGGDYVPPLSSFGAQPTHLRFSPDQQWLVYSGFTPGRTESASIQLWNAATGEKGPEFKGNVEPPALVAFSADSQRLLSVAPSGTVKVWRLPEPSPRELTPATFRETLQRLTATSPDTRWSADAPRYLPAPTTQPPQPPHQVTWSSKQDGAPTRSAVLAGPAEHLQFSADRTLLAAISIDPEAKLEEAAELKVWDVASGKERLVHRFGATEQPQRQGFGSSSQTGAVARSASATIEISPAGQRLALVLGRLRKSTDRSVQVWSLADGRLQFVKSGSFDRAQFSPDEKILLSTSFIVATAELHAWDASTGESLWSDEAQATPLAFSADSTRLAGLRVGSVSPTERRGGGPSNFESSTIVVWEASSGTVAAELKLPGIQIARNFSLSPDGQQLAVVTANQITVYDVDSGLAIHALENYGATVQSARFSPDGQRIVTSTQVDASAVNSRSFGSRSGPFGSSPFGSSLARGLFSSRSRAAPAEIRVYDAITGQEVLAGTTESGPLASLSGNHMLALAPLPLRVQAEELVDWLAAPDADGRLAPRREIVRRIEANSSLSDELRQLALAHAAVLKRNAAELAYHAWITVQSPGRDRADYERARELIIEADGQPPGLNYPIALGVAHYRLGEYAAALAALERGAQLTSDGRPASNAVDAFFFLAMTEHQLGNTERARETFYRAELNALIPSGLTATADRGTLGRGTFGERVFSPPTTRTESGSLNEAATLLGIKTIAQISADRENVLSDVDFDRVLASQNERIRQQGTASAFYDRFGLWNQHGDLECALEDIEEAVRLSPRTAMYVNNRAWTNSRMGELDRALADQNEAERLDPQYEGSYPNRSIVWSLKGEYDKALHDIETSLRLTPGNPKALLSRGWVWEKLAQPEKAQKDYSAALKYYSQPVLAYKRRARLWMERREYDRAIADYDQVILLEPENPDNFYLRGLARRDKGEYGKSIEDFDQVIRLSPTFPNAYRENAWLLSTCPDDKHLDGQRAVELATKAVELTRERNSEALATLAAACAEIGDFATAVKHQEKALRLATMTVEKARYESRLALYREGKPYRDSPAATDQSPESRTSNCSYEPANTGEH